MLPSRVMCLLSFFDVWGFNTGSSYISSRQSIMNFIIFIHILMVIFYSIQKILFTIFLYQTVPLVEAINELIQYSSAFGTYWLIIIDSLLLRREHRLFWTFFQNNEIKYFNSRAFQVRSFLVKFVAYLAICMTLFFSIYLLNDFAYSVVNFVYCALCLMCQIRCFYYIFCLKVLSFQLSLIDNESIRMKSLLHLENYSQLLRSREFYHEVYKMTLLLNEFFGWSHVALILYYFYKLLAEFNWCYAHIYEQPPLKFTSEYTLNFFFVFTH